MKDRPLYVYVEDSLAGTLRLTRQGEYIFQYEEGWLNNELAFPLSYTLPMSAEPYRGVMIQNFFGNLLPEEQIRRVIAQRHGVSEQNDYELLSLLGGECAGALSIVPEKLEGAARKKYQYEAINEKQLGALIEELPYAPFLTSEEGVSLSLAGAQNKLPLYDDGKNLYLPKYGAPSNCILKPAIPGVEHSVENELYCMCLAKAIGLNCAAVKGLKLSGKLSFLTQRYDRIEQDGRVQRLHQEDFCQLCGISHSFKYEVEGGPGMKECADIIREFSTSPLVDIQSLLDWCIFNVCIGNMDAHGKNLSMLYHGTERRLAPFYDLLSTMFYGDRFSKRLAMSIGGKTTVDGLDKSHWTNLANDLGLSSVAVLAEVKRITQLVLKAMVPVADKLIAEVGKAPVFNAFLKFVATRTRAVSAGVK